MESTVWLGVPSTPADEAQIDFTVSRLGGLPSLFRTGTSSENESADNFFICPRCKRSDAVSLLAQVHAPVECLDRVLFVLLCARCSESSANERTSVCERLPLPLYSAAVNAKGSHALLQTQYTSFCFALRSQSYNAACAELEHVEEAEKCGCETVMFVEDDDWGDEKDSDGVASTTSNAQVEQACNVPYTETISLRDAEYTLAPAGQMVALGGTRYSSTGFVLDWRVEPAKQRVTRSEAEQARELEVACSEAKVDTTSIESAVTESASEKCVRKYVERIARCGAQCVRWCLTGSPLRTSLNPLDIPPCPRCAAARQFEMQLTSPSIYFLTRDTGETANAHLHYSNVLVYTCSNHCNDTASPYIPEYVVVEGEI